MLCELPVCIGELINGKISSYTSIERTRPAVRLQVCHRRCTSSSLSTVPQDTYDEKRCVIVI